MPMLLTTERGSCEFQTLTLLILIIPSAAFRRFSLCLRGGNTAMTRLPGSSRLGLRTAGHRSLSAEIDRTASNTPWTLSSTNYTTMLTSVSFSS